MAIMSKKGLVLALVAPIALAQASAAFAGSANKRTSKLESEVSALKMQVKQSKASNSMLNSGNKNISVTLSGQINRAMILADDVKGRRVYNVDNDMTSTRFRIVGNAKMSCCVSMGTNLEVQLEPNSSADVSQLSATGNSSQNFNARKAEIFFDHKKFGRLTFGKGSTASDDTAEYILSGTYNVSYSYVPGGFVFRPLGQSKADFMSTTNNPSIGSVFNNFDGLGRDERVRYDSPNMHGLVLSTSYVNRERWDIAPVYKYKGKAVKAVAAVGLADLPDGSQLSSSASMLHKDSGVSASVSWSKRWYDLNGRKAAYQIFTQLGWKHDFFSFGRTNMFIDHIRSGNTVVERDKGDSEGIGFEQRIKSISADLYASVRNHRYEQKGVDFHRIMTTMVGVRVKF